MTVELTPNGTRGGKMPKLPRPLGKAMTNLGAMVMGLSGMRILHLTTVGYRSGHEHTVPLGWFPDGNNSWLIVASAGGAAKHPDWYVNMARNPDQVWIEIDKRKFKVRPESLKGAEREAAWRRIIALAPNYEGYQKKTDREIPIVRLKPASS